MKVVLEVNDAEIDSYYLQNVRYLADFDRYRKSKGRLRATDKVVLLTYDGTNCLIGGAVGGGGSQNCYGEEGQLVAENYNQVYHLGLYFGPLSSLCCILFISEESTTH